MTNGNEYAFVQNGIHKGLTKREYFAAMALQGAISDKLERGKWLKCNWNII